LKLGAKIFGILGSFLLLYLLVGFLLPGTWTAQSEALLPAPPSVVFPFLNRMDQWQRWTPMPESGSQPFGPDEGVGAGLRWDDPRYGRGQIQLTESRPDEEVAYVVDVEGGALRINGKLNLVSEGSGTHLEWEEAGDFGWNPMMGYTARGMAASQLEAMRSSLEQLIKLVSFIPG
jgi:hypothetical protein